MYNRIKLNDYMKRDFHNRSLLIKKYIISRINKLLRIIIKNVLNYIYSVINYYSSQEKYNFNIFSRNNNFIIRLISYIFSFIYKGFDEFNINYLLYYLFKLEEFILKILVFQKKYELAIKYSNKLFIRYPEFSSSITTIYEFILRKYTYEGNENIKYFLKLNGINNGIIYITDSHSSKTPISLYYSALNKYKKIKILGIYNDIYNINKINNLTKKYHTIDLDLKFIFKNNNVIDRKFFNQLEQYKNQGLTINLWINEYIHFKNYKYYKKLLNIITNIFVFNKEIKKSLIKYKKINHQLIKVVDIINYKRLINPYKTTIYHNNNKSLCIQFRRKNNQINTFALKEIESLF